jgi:hypothetical protein
VLKKLEYFPIQYKVNLALENKEKREKELAEQSVHWETFKKPRPKVRRRDGARELASFIWQGQSGPPD